MGAQEAVVHPPHAWLPAAPAYEVFYDPKEYQLQASAADHLRPGKRQNGNHGHEADLNLI